MPIESLHTEIDRQATMNSVRASLIICTYDRADLLEIALDSLTAQTADPTSFEIIVVDNNSNDRTETVVNTARERLPNLRYLFEATPGLISARDAGFRNSRAEWVVYLDDDIKADPNLVDRFLEVIDEHPFDCVGGLCLPWFEHDRPKWLHDRYVINEVDLAVGTGVLEKDFAKGALIAFRRAILEELGGFKEPNGRSLGMREGTIAYGEETRVQVEMRKRGYVIGFDHLLRVDHLVHEDRLHPNFFIRMRFAKGRDYWDTFGIEPTLMQIMKRFPFVILKPIARVPGVAWQWLTRRDYHTTNAYLDIFYPAATMIGQIHGGLSIRLGRRGST